MNLVRVKWVLEHPASILYHRLRRSGELRKERMQPRNADLSGDVHNSAESSSLETRAAEQYSGPQTRIGLPQ